MVDRLDPIRFNCHQLHQSADTVGTRTVISKQFHLSHSELSNIFGAFQFCVCGDLALGGIFLESSERAWALTWP